MEKLKIQCPNCKSFFRERTKAVRNGFQAQCPNCMKLLTFDSSSDHPSIRRALQEAKRLRDIDAETPTPQKVAIGR